MNRQTINRREAIKQALMSYVGATVGGSLLSACVPSVPPRTPTCPIGWQPNALKPVFYGARDYGTADGAPGPCRVFFPSLDGAVFDAPILEGCGRYSLILFAHGDCHAPGETEHYKKWEYLPIQLARSGYVVIVPELPDIGNHPSSENHAALPRMTQIVAWMRGGWVHHNVLLPTTGVAGHSYGAMLAARFAATNYVAAYASISGVWEDWPSQPRPIEGLAMPMFFCRGRDFYTNLGNSLWNNLALPKHRAVFENVEHWDYLPPGATVCDQTGRGECPLAGALTADLVTMFFAKYLPLEDIPNLSTWHLFDLIPASLIPPPLLLSTDAQRSFAGGHLNGFSRLGSSHPNCRVTLTWDTHFGSGTSTQPPP